MKASSKVAVTIIGVFTAVFTILVMVMYFQAKTDIADESEAAMSMATTLVAQNISAAEIQSILKYSRHLTVEIIDSPTASLISNTSSHNFWASLDEVAKPISLPLDDQRQLVIRPNYRAELNEIINTVEDVFFIFIFALILTLTSLHYAVNSRLRSLVELSSALDSLGDGDFEVAVKRTDIAEINTLVNHYNHLAKALSVKQAQVMKLRHRLTALQENERRLLARELHDNLGQLMTGISVQTYMLLQQKNAPEYIEQGCRTIQQQCDHVQAGIRELTDQLYPVSLNRLGLVESIHQLVDKWQEIHNIEVHWFTNQSPLDYEPNRDTHIYRIFQEILNNIVKHASATQVNIAIVKECAILKIKVQDNGVGLPASLPTSSGLGMQSMRERASLIGAAFTINNSHNIFGRGVSIDLTIPVTKTSEESLHEHTLS
jgi:two-component system sensor histidine kinase UhpB